MLLAEPVSSEGIPSQNPRTWTSAFLSNHPGRRNVLVVGKLTSMNKQDQTSPKSCLYRSVCRTDRSLPAGLKFENGRAEHLQADVNNHSTALHSICSSWVSSASVEPRENVMLSHTLLLSFGQGDEHIRARPWTSRRECR